MKNSKRISLMELKDALENLEKFVVYFSGGERPYFYRMLDYMKNNIELYQKTGGDLQSLDEILYRDWCEANNLWYGLSSFKISEHVCKESIEIYYQYSLLVKKIADYFEL